MKTYKVRNTLLLVLTASIWGVAFVAQSAGSGAFGAYTFNCLRFLMGSAVLIPVITLLDRMKLTDRKPETPQQKKLLLKGGITCGILLCIASNFQQLSFTFGASVAKAGFLTACYILIVPVLGIFLGRKCGWNIWTGVAITMAGLYMLCMDGGSFSFAFSDILLILCALVFSLHILAIDHFTEKVDGVRMSFIQFAVAGIISAVPMFFSDMGHSFEGFGMLAEAFSNRGALIALLYAGILSSGIAYTTQIVGQQGINPAIASLILSLESVISAIAGWIILGETMTPREITGCILIFAAIILAQLPLKSLNLLKKSEKAGLNPGSEKH